MIDESFLNEPTDPSWPKIGDTIKISLKAGGDELTETEDTGKIIGYGVLLDDIPGVQIAMDTACCCSGQLHVIMRVDLL